jgi:hypothetical protein
MREREREREKSCNASRGRAGKSCRELTSARRPETTAGLFRLSFFFIAVYVNKSLRLKGTRGGASNDERRDQTFPYYGTFSRVWRFCCCCCCCCCFYCFCCFLFTFIGYHRTMKGNVGNRYMDAK